MAQENISGAKPPPDEGLPSVESEPEKGFHEPQPFLNGNTGFVSLHPQGLVIQIGQWSKKTFGPNVSNAELFKRICCELEEVLTAQSPEATAAEWVDVILIAIDGYRRAGGQELITDLRNKFIVNIGRKWDPRTREHITHHRRRRRRRAAHLVKQK